MRAEGKIPAVLNGGAVVALPYAGELKAGEKLVEIGDGKGLITTDITVTNDAVRKLIYTPDIFAIEMEDTVRSVWPSSRRYSSTR